LIGKIMIPRHHVSASDLSYHKERPHIYLYLNSSHLPSAYPPLPITVVSPSRYQSKLPQCLSFTTADQQQVPAWVLFVGSDRRTGWRDGGSPGRAFAAAVSAVVSAAAHEVREHLDRQREDDGRVLLGRDPVERLKVAKLQRRRRLVDDVRRLTQRLRRSVLAFRSNHLYQHAVPFVMWTNTSIYKQAVQSGSGVFRKCDPPCSDCEFLDNFYTVL